MKKIITTLMMAIAIGQSAFAQTAPASMSGGSSQVSTAAVENSGDVSEAVPVTPSVMPTGLPFLSSKAALKTYAIEAARSAFLDLQSPGLVYSSWGTGTGWMSSMRETDVLAQFNSLRVAVPMANTADYVKAIATIKNGSGRVLFSGEAWQLATLGPGGYIFPKMWFSFVIAKIIPIKFDRSVRWARARYVDSRGQTVGNPIDLNTVNGEVDFRSDLAGQILLELGNQDGNVYEYDLRQTDGRRINVETVTYDGSESYIDGLYNFTDPSVISWEVWSSGGVGQNPAFEITMTQTRWLPVSVTTSEGAGATAYNVRAMGTMDWSTYPLVPGAKFVQLPLTFGTWYIVPVWNPNDFREPEPDLSNPTLVIPGKG